MQARLTRLCGALLFLASCKAPATNTPTPPRKSAAPVVKPAVQVPVAVASQGTPVVAPVVSNNGSNLTGLVSAPATLVSNNGGNLVAKAPFGLLAAVEEALLQGVTVRLLDAAGQPVKDAQGKPYEAVTGPDGRYSLPYSGNTANLLVKVVLPDAKGELLALVPGGAARADLDLASTLTMGYILEQYVKPQADAVQVLNKLPADVAAETRARARAAFTAGSVALPDALTPAKVVATVDSLRKGDSAFDGQLETVKRLLVVGAQSASFTDGPALEAQLGWPGGVALGPDGSLYIADASNYLVRKVDLRDPARPMLATLAGSGAPGSGDGRGSAAAFMDPYRLAVDDRGHVFLLDNGLALREIEPDGTVKTVALGFEPRLLSAIASDGAGRLYLADQVGLRILRLDARKPGDRPELLYQGPGEPPQAAEDPPELGPQALALGPDGAVYFTEGANPVRLARLGADGKVETLLTGPGKGLDDVRDLAVAPDGRTLYVADYGSDAVHAIDLATASARVWADKVGDVPFDGVAGLALSRDGSLLVSLEQNNRVVRVSADGKLVTPVAGNGKKALIDGAADQTLFDGPAALVLLPDGGMYVADHFNGNVRQVDRAGNVTTLLPDDTPGLSNPYGLARDPAGNLYIADAGSSRILKVDPARKVTILAGLGAGVGHDGNGTDAAFTQPICLAFDPRGDLLITDAHALRKLDLHDPRYPVTTLAGAHGGAGAGRVDGKGDVARFNELSDVVADADGTVYLADSGNHRICVLDTAGVVRTLAGSPDGEPGEADGVGTAARFDEPTGLALDPAGTLYVGDTGNNAIRRIDVRTGAVTTLPKPERAYNGPAHLALDGLGNLFVVDAENRQVRQIKLP